MLCSLGMVGMYVCMPFLEMSKTQNIVTFYSSLRFYLSGQASMGILLKNWHNTNVAEAFTVFVFLFIRVSSLAKLIH